MNADEEYVRARWVRVLVCDGSYRHYAKGTILLIWSNHQFYEFKDFSAARAFTEKREREIAEISGCVALLKGLVGLARGSATDVTGMAAKLTSTLKREQAVLAELRRGMKEGSE